MKKMVILLYIIPTLLATIFVGFFAPIVGIIVGFFIHLFIMVYEIHNVVVTKDKRDKVLAAVEDYKRERALQEAES
ncbi:hypothetical protein [Paenisporosarcina cavernae]|uniref:Uncharacterized protein n=1 Tax=Paenisporosarcina cavernae TaxID=2320858 RepID=A0A385YX45_9BACL|nr:hypothetical protein [Paenisporosarcina cavernae]AYC30082.1 hypothetical protein D3873_09430 [Paenisporosarcina cavernae]